MASPVIGGYTAVQTSATFSTIAINPSSYIVTGSLLDEDWVVLIITSGSGVSSSNVPSPPVGWTNFVPFASPGTGTMSFGVWGHQYSTSEPTYAIPQTTGQNTSSYRLVFVRGALDITNWLTGTFDIRSNTGTTTTNVAASLTTTANNTLSLLISGERTLAAETSAQVTCTNFTKLFFDNTYDHTILVGTKDTPTPGATGSSTITYPNTHANNGIAGIIGIPGPDDQIPLMWVL